MSDSGRERRYTRERMGYSIRRAEAADRAHVEGLLRELFPNDDVGTRYDWIHLGCPQGRSLVWLATDDSGAVAAMASYFPRDVLVQGKQVRAALGGDCWVRPEFRRRGIGRALHERGRLEMPREGIEVMFGTPTKANESPLLQAGARNIGHVARFARPLWFKQVPLSAQLLSRGWGKARLQPIAGVDARVDEVWQRTKTEVELGTVRDGAFYDWRFSRSPSKQQSAFVIMEDGEPIAACALERVDKYLRVVDLLAPLARWGAALGALVRHSAEHHPEASVLTLRLIDRDGGARRLWRWGFVPRDRDVFNVLLPEGEPGARVFYEPARWLVSYADTDIDHG
jgi:GNAT superfamily N-acetyltransferase